MIGRLILWFLSKLFVITRVPNSRGETYLRRFKLYRTEKRGIYLHQILMSDEDRELHDHPWEFTSIILWGGYTELTPERAPRPYGMGRVIRHKATDYHRLILSPGQVTWTLVFVGPKMRDWGFKCDEGHVDHKTYLDRKYGPNTGHYD